MKLHNFKIIFLGLAIVLVSSCSDFLDINEDPNNPTTARLIELMPSVQVNMAGLFNGSSGGLGNYTSLYTHHTTQRGQQESYYQFNSSEFGVQVPWTLSYSFALQDMAEIERIATESGETQYIGVVKVMRSIVYSTLVDIYGDVPFSEANLGTAGPYPTFDDDQTIYDAILTELDEAVGILNAATDIAAGDLMYNGDLGKWKKLANTWKLNMLNNVRLTRDVSGDVNKLIADNDMIGAGDDFQFNYGTGVSPNSRNTLYVQEWAPAASQVYINPYFFEVMSGINTFEHGNDLYNNIADPRVPYYIYNQLPDGAADSDAENPCSYCPSISGTGFLSIYSFSFDVDPNEGFDQGMSSSILGLYPVGGLYDDGTGGTANFNGTGNAPERILTYYDHLYIRAELAHTGVTTEDARGLLETAIRESFRKVNEVAGVVGNAPSIDVTAIDDYVAEVLSRYDANPDDQLAYIMTEKWKANFGSAISCYNDVRRTGLPLLHDPDTDALGFTSSQGFTYPTAFPWPQDELNANLNAPAQKNIYNYKIFWDE